MSNCIYNYVYLITNTINNKIYIGVHGTNNINDGYMGSGVYLKRAQEKHGIENFKKEILFYFETYEEALQKEKELVTEEFLQRDDVYNLTLGGFGGGFYSCNKFLKENPEVQKNISALGGTKASKMKVGVHDPKYKPLKSEWQKRSAIACKENGNGFSNSELQAAMNKLSQTPEAREKRINTLKEIQHQQGEKNSQFGTMWIYNPLLKQNKKIKKDEMIPDGWYKGRIADWCKY